MHKRIVTILLLLCFLLGTVFPVYAEEVTTEDTAPTEETEPVEDIPAAELTISNTADFLAFAKNCRLDSYSQNLIVYLAADIDLAGTGFEGIPIFCGILEGGGHTISGLDISVHGSEHGLFRHLTLTAVVRDLNVSGQVAPQGSRSTVGGIAGENAGRIENCSFTGTVSGGDHVGGLVGINTQTGIIENSRASGTIHGNHFVGGIAGDNSGVIQVCQNHAEINVTAQQNIVDISDITLDTLTGAEASNTVTDIGGIAGTSSGMIRECKNYGTVGYKHMGYNIGGIAGSQSGYIANCENHAPISGRKEVGGIIGQMEPFMLLRYDTDTLQILRSEVAVLTDLIDRATMNAEENTSTVQSLLWTLQYHVSRAEDALYSLRVDPENPELLDLESVVSALQTLRSSITGISNTLQNLVYAVGNTTSDLSEDMDAIGDQVAVIEGILNNSEKHLGGSVTDISDADTPEDMTSEIESCTNYGPVLADLNGGGIVGAIALENDLDPEDDVQISGDTTLNSVGQLRSVVRGCTNTGSIDVRKQNAGGIVGWQSMGLVQNCLNTGDLIAETTDYAGGIAGRSQGYIRQSFVKCVIHGDAYVGGIAGSGTIVTDCRSIAQLTGTERTGAILGFAAENRSDTPIRGNVYFPVNSDPGAIDGISYAGRAEPLDMTGFLALEDLPELFRTVSVTFTFEDGTSQSHSLPLGQGLGDAKIPAVPEKACFSGVWAGLKEANLSAVYFDLAFHLSYTSHDTVIQSTEARGNRPLLLVQGDFAPGATVTISPCADGPSLGEKEILLESQLFTVADYDSLIAGRYLIPESCDPELLTLYIRSGNRWTVVDHTVDGSYLVFALYPGDDAIALTQTERSIPELLPFLAAAAAIVLLAIIIFAFRKNAGRKKKKTAPPTAENTQ